MTIADGCSKGSGLTKISVVSGYLFSSSRQTELYIMFVNFVDFDAGNISCFGSMFPAPETFSKNPELLGESSFPYFP